MRMRMRMYAPGVSTRDERQADCELGSVWPVAVLFASGGCALVSTGAWVSARAVGVVPPWPLLLWIAEHAMWGTLIGIGISLILRLGARFDPRLIDASERRAAAARLALIWVGLAFVCLAGLIGTRHAPAPAPLVGLLIGALLSVLVARLCLGRLDRWGELRRLDPARVAVCVALLTLPLATGIHAGPSSLWGAWRALLGVG